MLLCQARGNRGFTHYGEVTRSLWLLHYEIRKCTGGGCSLERRKKKERLFFQATFTYLHLNTKRVGRIRDIYLSLVFHTFRGILQISP